PTGLRLERDARWLFASAYLRERTVAAGLALGEAPVVHPGIDPATFPEADARRWDGSLLCLGRLDPRKGVATAIEALGSLPGHTLRCVGAGDREHGERLAALAAERGL